ncbi:50S ribosomal protein L5 [Candidatus Peregrinibacteria bacterium]|nr:MAG: 50S ribosomal protein L5 [Candidatus Peregrinibacteria bacterium]
MSFTKEYRQNIVPELQKKLGNRNIHAVPALQKITVSVGVGSYLKNEKTPASVVDGITRVTGQKPIIRNSTKSISNFKLREGMPVGVSVTLRKEKMYDFLERLVKIVFPRIRDFRGFSSRSFDGRGNYSLGIRDHLIFPEIPTDEIIRSFGVQVTFTTSAKNDKEAKLLLEAFGFPFQKS